MHRSMGIRLRIAIVVAVVSTLAVASVGVATTWMVERSAEAEIRRLSEESLATGEIVGSLLIEGAGSEPANRILTSSTGFIPVPGNAASTSLDGESFIVVAGDTAFGGVSAPITGLGAPQFATAFTPSGGLDQAVAALTKAFWIGGPVLILLLAGASWFLAGRALQPVAAIVEKTRRISTSSPHERVPIPPGRNELTELASTMNQMLDRIEAGSDRQRQFISDASHELRTPLTALMGDVEIALTHPAEVPWHETAERVLQQGERLDLLVENLLEAATQAEEPGMQAAPAESVNLHSLARTEIALLQGSLNAAVSVTLSPPEGHHLVAGDPASLSSAIRNLLSNANRHARSLISVAVSLDERAQVVLTVDDDGPGVKPQHRQVIFERFSRLDEARAVDGGGSGLGLAIVRSIADRHAGRSWVEESPSGGARFVLALPGADAPV